MKSKRFFFFCFLNFLWFSESVKISSLKRLPNFNITSSAIGPPCSTLDGRKETCTLGNGKAGQCSSVCYVPPTKDADICCHVKYPTVLNVYFCCEKIGATPYAVGGIKAEKHEFPYMAALGWFSKEKILSYDYKCGGAFISTKFVLTAAHCAYIDGIEPVVILPGGSNLKPELLSSYPLPIETVHVHTEYDDEYVYNDIALVQLVGEYTGGIIELWRRRYIANTTFTAIGYGDTIFGGTSSDVLIKVFIDYVSTNECQSSYVQQETVPRGIIKTQVCAKDPNIIMDTCQGDSGGPLIMTLYNNNRDEKKDYLFGITSFGQGCALSPPGVYTLVSAFTNWINEHTKTGNITTTRDNRQWAWI